MPKVIEQSKIPVQLDRRCGLTQNANSRLQCVVASPKFELRYQESQSDLLLRERVKCLSLTLFGFKKAHQQSSSVTMSELVVGAKSPGQR